MEFIKRLFHRTGTPEPSAATEPAPRISPLDLGWRDDTTMPVVDWRAAHAQAKVHDGDAALRDFWWSAAIAWLEALRMHLGGNFRIETSKSFALLSSLDERSSKLTIQTCERYRKRILWTLEGVASAGGHGPHVVLVFDDADQYYDYVSNYYPKEGTFAMSAGMFIKHGYGHFVFRASRLDRMEPTIAHELTHCLLAPLPIPAWINEGTAVNTEHRLCPHYTDPRQRLHERQELLRDRAEFWNAQTIQEFWTGKSFKRPDKGNQLSYDLAAELAGLIAKDYPRYRAFMNRAHRKDAGVAAAAETLGFTLGDLAGAVLGEGNWEPDPEAWREGTEKGQF